jgi:hypothetical protein
MQSLWRAMALVWLGGIASPALAPDTVPFDTMNEERPLDANATTDQVASVELPLGLAESPASGRSEPSPVASGGDRQDGDADPEAPPVTE